MTRRTKQPKRKVDEFDECLEVALRVSNMLQECDAEQRMFYHGQLTMAEMLYEQYQQVKRREKGKKK